MNEQWSRQKMIKLIKETIPSDYIPPMVQWVEEDKENRPSTHTILRYFNGWSDLLKKAGKDYNEPGIKYRLILSLLKTKPCSTTELKEKLKKVWYPRKREIDNLTISSIIYDLRRQGFIIETDTIYTLID